MVRKVQNLNATSVPQCSALDAAAGLAAVVTVDAGDGHTSSARIYEIGRGRAQVTPACCSASLQQFRGDDVDSWSATLHCCRTHAY